MKKKTRIVPRAKQVLVKPDSAEARVTDSGLVVPSNIEQEQKAIGIVIAVGAEIKDIKVGDRVIYGVYVGEAIKLRENGKEVDYKILFDEDVLAFLKD